MEKVIMFGSKHWPGCIPAKEFLSENGVKFVYRDITESMLNLKLFLNHRDTHPSFNEIREEGRVGLPCLVMNRGEEIVFDVKLLDIKDFKK